MKAATLLVSALLAVSLLLAGCTSAPPPVQEQQARYVIGIDADFPPFTSLDSSGSPAGFDIDAARYVAAAEGLDVVFVAVPWDGIIPALENGDVDIVWSGLTVTDERQARVSFTHPYLTVNQSIAARAGAGTSMEDVLAGRARIGVQAGSTGEAWAAENLVGTGAMADADLVRFPGVTGLTGALEAGRIDASIIQAPAQERAIAGRNLSVIGTIPAQESYAVAVRQGDTVLLATLDRGLLRLKGDPYWQQLKETYGLDGAP